MEEEKKNLLQGLLDFYNESVAEYDKLNLAELFKDATDKLLKHIAEYFAADGISFTPYDIEFSDGYFIFGHGTNSVVRFRIKEAEGWLAGIWWSAPSKEQTKTYQGPVINCELFCQFEETIDKFKPSYSIFEKEFVWQLKEDNKNLDADFAADKVFRLMLTYPYLAWFRDVHHTNFNIEYISNEEAIAAYNVYRMEEKEKAEITEINDREIYDCVKYIFQKLIDDGDAFIDDSGANISPRYKVVIRNLILDDGKPLVNESGYYNMFDWCSYRDAESDKKLLEDTIAKCKERAGKYYWFNPMSHCVYIADDEKYYKWKEKHLNE